MTPEAGAALAQASDLVGYAPYLDRCRCAPASAATPATIASSSTARATRWGWRRKGGRSRSSPAAIPASSPWRRRCSRRSRPASRRGARLAIEVAPGITAMQAAAARLGAPLGHDFCAISLSDNLKSWDVVARRLGAAADGDFVIALYNPASKARPDAHPRRVRTAAATARRRDTPVAFARAVGRADERIVLTDLGEADPVSPT